jgi:hypothetical protein
LHWKHTAQLHAQLHAQFTTQNHMSGNYLPMNAWREILARVFTSVSAQDNVTPEWLINPATKRRLKLDKIYPDLGIAVRFEGLTAKGQGRQSDWEAAEAEQRDGTREELCRRNGIELMRIDIDGEDPVKTMDALLRVIARAGRTIEQSSRTAGEKARWMTVIGAARERANSVRLSLTRNSDQSMATLSEAWRDRETALAAAPDPAPRPPPTAGARLALREGDRLQHERFGPGVVTQLTPNGDGDTKVTILFDGAGERTLLLSLAHDKLSPE